jgi:hypothetical protein
MKKPRPKPTPYRVFNFRQVPTKTFFKIKMAAAAEQQSAREWLLSLAEERIKELEAQGKLPKDP